MKLRTFRFLFAVLITVATADAGGICSPGTATISDANTTFCVSDYGWSDQLFSNFSPGINLLGDSAQFISYTPSGGFTVTSWLTPNLSSGAVTSTFSVNPAGHVTNIAPDHAESVITDGTVTITIDSFIVQDMVRQTFAVFTNIDLTDLQFFEYDHLYPDGAANSALGTMTYHPVLSIENSLVNGLSVQAGSHYLGVCGGVGLVCTTPNSHDISSAANVQSDIEALSLNGVGSAPMDVAGALMWNVGSLTAGSTLTFTQEIVVPELPTVFLMLASVTLLVLTPHLRLTPSIYGRSESHRQQDCLLQITPPAVAVPTSSPTLSHDLMVPWRAC